MSFDLKVNLDFKPSCYYKEGNIKFDPPIYLQRYCFVSKVLGHDAFKGKIKKVIDFGCAELKFFNTIRYNLPLIEHVIEIDIDGELLKRHAFTVKPLIMNFFNQRTAPLKVEVYKGNIASKHECLLKTDALVAIELIEHLNEDVLKDMPDVVFDYMKPKLALFTTPNREANVLFPDLEGFRHWDHKFEWTRAEFEKWAHDICERYPNYSVQFYQIGEGPPETEQLNFGGVSQCAVFLNKEFVEDVNAYKITENSDDTPSSVMLLEDVPTTSQESQAVLDETNDEVVLANSKEEQQEENNESDVEFEIGGLDAGSSSDLSGYSSDNEYELICEVDYPFTPDNRSERQKIIDESKYQISRMSRVEKYIDEERNVSLIPLETLFDFVFPVTKSRDQLRHLLIQEGYKIVENDVIEISPEDEGDDGLESSDEYSEPSDDEDLPGNTEPQENPTWEEENWD